MTDPPGAGFPSPGRENPKIAEDETPAQRRPSTPPSRRTGAKPRLWIEHLQKIIDTHPMVRGDSLEDAGERARLDWIVIGDDFVVLAIALGGHPNV